jgi:hypothetical protein
VTDFLQHRVLEPAALAAAAGRRRALTEEYSRLVADANGLIDALNRARR